MKLLFSENLYLSDSLKEKRRECIQHLKNRKKFPVYEVFIINDSGQVEFFKSVLLIQKFYDGKTLKIHGIASNAEEAKDLLEQMVRDSRESGFGLRLADFLSASFHPSFKE